MVVGYIPKHNVLIRDRDMNAHKVEEGNNKFYLYIQPNWNGEYLADSSLENSFTCSNSKFLKKGRENYGSRPTQITLERSEIICS